MKFFLFLFSFLYIAIPSYGVRISFLSEDSILIEQILKEAKQKPIKNVLYFAQKMIDKPYTAFTLEHRDPEELIVNLRELDCTTFVENALALYLCWKNNSTSFKDFCKQLEKIRYEKGVCNGYVSRLHYFSQWIDDNTELNIVKEVTSECPFLKDQILDLYYMSKNPKSYKILTANPNFVSLIAQKENIYKGRKIAYIPKKHLNQKKENLKCIQEGDILAFVTNKKGLDTSHIGFAFFDPNGFLHAMNASSLRKKVVNEQETLFNYIAKQPWVIGIRVIRIRS